MTEEQKNMRGLEREWNMALIVGIGGLVVAIAVAGYFGYREMHRRAQVAVVHAVAPTAHIDRKELQKIEVAVCNAEIAGAQSLAVVPAYAKLAEPNLVRTRVRGRFICVAETHLTQYLISADLRCEKLIDVIRDPRCVSVFRVMLKDGRLVYSRPD